MTHPAPETRHARPASRARGLGLGLLISLLLINPVDTLASSTEAPESQHPVAGFHETVWVVRDLDPWIAALTEVAGWELVHRGAPDPRWATVWGLEEGSTLEEALVRNPGTDRGWVRLTQITVAGEPSVAPQSRPHAQTWDTGGHFDVNLRAIAVDRRLDELEAHGFAAYTAPVEFTFGPFRVREVLARGPDGIVLAMIERLEPTLEGWPHLERLSRIFNATQIVADFDSAFDFYTRILGFQVYLEHEGPSKAEGPNVLGLPHNLATKIPRKVAILSPHGRNDGSVEILAFEGATGADFSAQALPPHRGIASLRFPVRGLEAWRATLVERGVTPSAITALELEPQGSIRVFTLQTPERALLTFFEPVP